MSAPVRLAAFGAVLAVLFAAAAVAGGVTRPVPERDGAARAQPGAEHAHAATQAERASAATAPAVHGLGVADGGLQLELEQAELRRGREAAVRFRILGPGGRPVRDYDVTHEKRMHLIVVRRDLTGFQHLHPELGTDGSWTAALTLDEAGSYRVFADFSHRGEARTLAGDLRVDGAADLQPLPAPAPAAQSDGGYDVRLDGGSARAGRESELRFSISRDGERVHTEPYLGAGGHLVALRDGDLAFLHVHPAEHDGAAGHDDAVRFAATFPTPGRYGLFLQFKHEGRVQTVAFTHEVTR